MMRHTPSANKYNTVNQVVKELKVRSYTTDSALYTKRYCLAPKEFSIGEVYCFEGESDLGER